MLAPYSRSENVGSSCSSVLLRTPSCGDTSRSVEHLQGAADERDGAGERRVLLRPAARAGAASDQVLVGDELVAVLLQDLAGEGAAADHEHLAVVLLQLLDQRHEVAVAADDDEGVDVAVGERHLQRVEGEVDVGAVLVAAGREVALHHVDRVLRQRAAVVAGARPVAVGDLGDDVAAFLDGFEHGSGVEVGAEGGLHADFDVVEVDEDRNLQFGFGQVGLSNGARRPGKREPCEQRRRRARAT